jgi:hypothetical protein
MYLSDTEHLLKCQYCGRPAKTKNSNAQHEIRCHHNPNPSKIKPSYGMLGKKGSNQHIKSKQTGEEYVIAESTRKKISEANKKRRMSLEARENHKKSMTRAVENHPESHLYGNSRRTKRYYHNDFICQGKWELDFYKWCLEQNLKVERGTSFPYYWEGQTRKYFPDFYLPELNLWIEVKGFETERDRAKWKEFPHCLKIVKEQEIKAIRTGNFLLVDLVGIEPTTLRL